MTRWAKEVSPDNVLPEYPRPIMVREKWMNLNGLWKYAITTKVFSVPMLSSKKEGQSWRYATIMPLEGWQNPAFNDNEWKTGIGAFGTTMTPNVRIGTVWDEKEIYIRKTFTLEEIPREFGLRMYHDEDAEVYINGKLVQKFEGWLERDGYLTALKDMYVGAGANVLREGENTITVYCRQTGGSQAIDVGILEVQKK